MLNLNSDTAIAINSRNVKTFYLFDIFYSPNSFSSGTSYSVGSVVKYSDLVYRAIIDNSSPSTAPPNGIYWEKIDYPLCYTNWDEEVMFSSKMYTPLPCEFSGITQTTDGKIEDSSLTVSNIAEDRLIQQIIETLEIINETVVVTQVFINPDTQNILTSDSVQRTFKIKGAKAKGGTVTFSLSIGFDAFLMKVPKRKMFRKFCRFNFKDEYCKYSGSIETCGKTWEDCLARNNTYNFGGFPGILNSKFYF